MHLGYFLISYFKFNIIIVYMNKKTHLAIIGTTTIIGAGFLGFAIWRFSNIHENNLIDGVKYTYKENTNGLIKLEEANIHNSNSSSKKEYFLGDDGLDILNSIIKKSFGFWARNIWFKHIIIGNENVINKREEGLYFPNTEEIFINTKKL